MEPIGVFRIGYLSMIISYKGIQIIEQARLTHTQSSNFQREIAQDPVKSIISLTNLLRGQLIKCFMTLSSNTLIFLVDKIFAQQKLSYFFNENISIP